MPPCFVCHAAKFGYHKRANKLNKSPQGREKPLFYPKKYVSASPGFYVNSAVVLINLLESCAFSACIPYFFLAVGQFTGKRFGMQKPAKVLLVDDDSTTTFLHAQLLRRLKVAEQFLVARNGVEAIQALERTCGELNESTGPLLVLLDVNMPVMNGIEFLEKYQQHPLAQKCPTVIVVLTSSAHPRDLERINALPVAADVLAKPLTGEKVAYILQRHFRRG